MFSYIFNNIRADESLQVLVFVCAPLTILLLGIVTHGVLRPVRRIVEFPNFSVKINIVGREEAYVYYDPFNAEPIEFPATRGRKSWISVRVPKNLRGKDAPDIIQHLALALEKLGYRYLIFRSNSTEAIPEEERAAAISELQMMGVQLVNSGSVGQVQRAVISNLSRGSGDQTKLTILKIQALMRQAQGVRENIEVLARSNEEKS